MFHEFRADGTFYQGNCRLKVGLVCFKALVAHKSNPIDLILTIILSKPFVEILRLVIILQFVHFCYVKNKL